MSDAIHILEKFKKNTDANATNKGFYYQYLITLDVWLENYINENDVAIYCETEDDIKVKYLRSNNIEFTQVKAYSKAFSFNSEEVQKSIVNFFHLYIEYGDKAIFTFHTNTDFEGDIFEKIADKKRVSDEVEKTLIGKFKREHNKELETLNKNVDKEQKFIDDRKNSKNSNSKKAIKKRIDDIKKYKEEIKNKESEFEKLEEFIQIKAYPFIETIKWKGEKKDKDDSIDEFMESIEQKIAKITIFQGKEEQINIAFSNLITQVLIASQSKNIEDRKLDKKMIDKLLTNVQDINEFKSGLLSVELLMNFHKICKKHDAQIKVLNRIFCFIEDFRDENNKQFEELKRGQEETNKNIEGLREEIQIMNVEKKVLSKESNIEVFLDKPLMKEKNQNIDKLKIIQDDKELGTITLKTVPVEVNGNVLNVSIYPVTFEEYDLFCIDTNKERPNKDYGEGKKPIVQIDWYEAKSYCEWLSKDNKTFCLLSSKDWEDIAQKNMFNISKDNWKEYILCNENSEYRIDEVNKRKCGDLGIYDMYGNIHEWCSDGENEYMRRAKGGSFQNTLDFILDTTNCSNFFKSDKEYELGFRVVYILDFLKELIDKIEKASYNLNESLLKVLIQDDDFKKFQYKKSIELIKETMEEIHNLSSENIKNIIYDIKNIGNERKKYNTSKYISRYNPIAVLQEDFYKHSNLLFGILRKIYQGNDSLLNKVIRSECYAKDMIEFIEVLTDNKVEELIKGRKIK